MSGFPILSPYPLFNDKDGYPLNDGYVYIGVAGQNPEISPISVYWDAAMTIPAAQPVRTSGGYPMRNGTPSTLYLASDCSMTVRDKNRKLVFYKTNSSEMQLVTGVLGSSVGSALVGFVQGGTGAVTRTVQDKLREVWVSVKDYGAVGDGTTDDTLAIQRAINYVMPTGGTIYFPAGTYKTTDTLSMINPDNSRKSGIYFVGQGRQSTKLLPYLANKPALKIRGVPTTGPVNTTFYWGGGLKDMVIDGTNSTGTSDGIDLLGVYYFDIDDCYVYKWRHGIIQRNDLVVDPNPDFTSTTINIRNTWIFYCTGIGIYQTGGISPFGWLIESCSIGLCGLAGVLIVGGGCVVTRTSISLCGFSSEGVLVSSSAIGLQVGMTSGTLNNIEISYCEFDSNTGKHISLDNWQGADIHDNRFIHNDRYSIGSLTPAQGLALTTNGPSSVVKNVNFARNFFRIDTVGTMIGVSWNTTSNVADIRCSSNTFSDQTGGAATITRYSGYTASNAHVRQNYIIDDRQFADSAAGNMLCVGGIPKPEYVGNCSSATVPAAGVIIYGTQDSVNNQIFGTASAYNKTTGVWTCPVTGYYDIDFSLSVQGATTAEYYQILLRKNAGTVTEFQFAGNGLARTLMQGRQRVYCSAGDTLDLYNNGVSGKTIMSSYSQLVIKQVS